jgi:uncharacterized membrane protein YfcA
MWSKPAMMDMIDTTSVVYPLSGLVVGVLVGLTGVGGGSLMTPLLLYFGVHATTAVGTDLLYAAVTKTVGTGMHSVGGSIDWRIVRRLALGSMPATALTLWLLHSAGAQSKDVTDTIKFVLGVALLLTAVSIFLRRRLADWVARKFGEPSDTTARNLTIFSGLVLGVLVSLSSVGAGALGVTALIMLYPATPLVKIVGSDIAHAVPLTLIAGAGHWLMGDVNWGLMGALLLGSIPGILFGSWLAPRLPEYGLRPALASVLTLVGANLVHVKLF